MKIIQIDLKDIKEVEQVTNLAFSSTPDSNIEDWFSMTELKHTIEQGRGICLKAIDDNEKIIGTVHAMQENPINGREGIEKWVITNLAVVSNITGKGVGGKLLNAIEAEARKKKEKRCLFIQI